MTAEIARVTHEDEADFLGLMQAFYRHEQFDFDPVASSRMVRHLLANPQAGTLYLARQAGGRAVGYVALTQCYSLEFGGPFALLDEIFVLPEAQGTGLGKQLIDVAAAHCRESGLGYLRLEVQRKNARAIEVYRTYGFRTEDRDLMSWAVR